MLKPQLVMANYQKCQSEFLSRHPTDPVSGLPLLVYKRRDLV